MEVAVPFYIMLTAIYIKVQDYYKHKTDVAIYRQSNYMLFGYKSAVSYVWCCNFTSAFFFFFPPLLNLALVGFDHGFRPKAQLLLCRPSLLWVQVNI